MRLGSRKSLVQMGENYLQISKTQDLQRMTSSLLRMEGKIGVDLRKQQGIWYEKRKAGRGYKGCHRSCQGVWILSGMECGDMDGQ